MNMRIIVPLVLLAVAFVPRNTLGDDRWGGTGHSHITAGAVQHLPQPLRHFFEVNSSYIADQSSIEPPGTHYIDIDYYPEFFAGTLPHDFNALIALYDISIVEDNGVGPWTAGDYDAALAAQMAGATSAAAWSNLRATAGALAHYVGDLHNPLHLTMDYNGQNSGHTGIHSRYESTMISRHLASDLPITPAPEHCVFYPSLVDALFDSIDVNYWYVDDILAADGLAFAADSHHGNTYYNVLWANTGGFTRGLFQEASERVASAWYTAWIDAGAPLPLPAPSALELSAWCLSGPGVEVAPGCTTSDRDGDGDCDLHDLAGWQNAQTSP
jgi:hypothetical protein